MADLIVQDFANLPGKNLVQVLSDEKEKMFGIQRLHVQENGSFSTSLGGSSVENFKVRI
jgi:hypothetical protein